MSDLAPSVQDFSSRSAMMIPLHDYRFVHIFGEEAQTYLQGQLTADVNALENGHATFAAHCDPKGKVISYFPLYRTTEHFYYFQPKSLHDAQLTAIKKYAVFSKITFDDAENVSLFGFAGNAIKEQLTRYFPQLPVSPLCVVETEFAQLLSLSEERFVAVVKNEYVTDFKHTFSDLMLYDESVWKALEMEAGYPLLDDRTMNMFLPQALNLQAIDAISFTKGCYTGQEMVARAKYRGANKRAMFWFEGKATNEVVSGSAIEMKLGENWRETGTVLTSILFADHGIWLQVVMNKAIDEDSEFRLLHQENSVLRRKVLPYSLDD